MVTDRVVYLHKYRDTGKVFYVGMGESKRPYSTKYRNKHWEEVVNNHQYDVYIIARGLTSTDALLIEKSIIAFYGLENLTNILPSSDCNYWEHRDKQENDITRAKMSSSMESNSNASKKCLDTETGAIYESIRDAANALGLTTQTLYKRLSGRTKIPTTIKLI